jgi:hypothetical protein
VIGSALPGKNSYTDTSADPNVPNYYYVVKAVNAAGTGVASNEISLLKGATPPPENVCTLPGLTQLGDAAGDTSPLTARQRRARRPGRAGHGPARRARLAALRGGRHDQARFHHRHRPGPVAAAANTSWYVSMKIKDPAPATTFHYRPCA